jgi:hypothetical protein
MVAWPAWPMAGVEPATLLDGRDRWLQTRVRSPSGSSASPGHPSPVRVHVAGVRRPPHGGLAARPGNKHGTASTSEKIPWVSRACTESTSSTTSTGPIVDVWHRPRLAIKVHYLGRKGEMLILFTISTSILTRGGHYGWL